MRNHVWLLAAVVGALLVLPLRGLQAQDKAPAKPPAERAVALMTVENISTKLGADAPLTDDQKAKINAAREEIHKKYEELVAKDDVKAAKEEVAKALDAVKAAQKKLDEAMGGFKGQDEMNKRLADILTDAQKEKMGLTKKAPVRKDAPAKKDAPKEAPKTE